ncbi:MAG: SulP family inorganic anion transporter [Panacagrimonas sp.]
MPDGLQRWLPLLGDVLRSRGQTLPQDALAGTITATLLIPQALAYALLAGLPPQVGLYASVLPPIVYALFGSSRTLAVGPVAVAAVMVSSALVGFAGDDPARYLSGALILSASTGAILLVLAVLRLGWLTHFISHPVLSGFTTGAAIYIIGTQLAPLTGIAVPREAGFVQTLGHLAVGFGSLKVPTFLFGAVTVMVLVLARKPLANALQRLGVKQETAGIVGRTTPLVLVVLATLMSALLHLNETAGVAVVGEIPRGLPAINFGFLKEPGWMALLPAALMIALIGYVESISVAKALAFRRYEKIDPDRELLALGLTNMGCACVGAMPVAGGFARSMVNFEAGAKTQAAAIVTAIWVALAALFFTGLLRDLPKTVLAAIIMVAVIQLIDFSSLRRAWTYDRGDGLAQGATIAGVLLLGVEEGLTVGAALAAVFFLYKTSRPHIAVVGRVAGTEHFRNIHRRVVETWPHILLLRVDENLYFANTPRVETQLMNLVLEREGLRDVILILSGVGHIDTSSLEMLESFERALAEKGICLHLAEIKGPVMDRLAGTHFVESLGKGRVHLSTDAAIRVLLAA